jgi:hypothetical protein
VPEKITADQRNELAKCYMLWCGVHTGDNVKEEMKVAKKAIGEMLKHWGKPVPADDLDSFPPEPPVWRGM